MKYYYVCLKIIIIQLKTSKLYFCSFNHYLHHFCSYYHYKNNHKIWSLIFLIISFGVNNQKLGCMQYHFTSFFLIFIIKKVLLLIWADYFNLKIFYAMICFFFSNTYFKNGLFFLIQQSCKNNFFFNLTTL